MSSNAAKFTALAIALGLAVTGSSLRAQGQGQGQGQPPQVQAGQSGDVEIEGVLEVQIEDATTGATVHHFLDTNNGRVRLKEKLGKSELLGLETGSQIKVRGRKNATGNELELAGGTTNSVTTLALAASNTFGQQKVAVIMVNFQDDTSQPYSWSDAANVTFGQVNDFYLANSYGQTSLTGDVFGWFTIAMSSTVCDTNTLASLADQAATNAGVESEQLHASRVRLSAQCLHVVGPGHRRRESVARVDQGHVFAEGRRARARP